MGLDTEIRTLAERQHALVTRTQLRALGATSHAIGHRIARGHLAVVTPAVVRLHGAPRTEEQLAMAAVLDAGPGAVLSHDSAAALWGLAGFHLSALHVSRHRTGTRRTNRLARVHYPTLLPAHHVTVLRAIPLTTPSRLLFDLAAREHAKKVERLVDSCWRRRLVSGRSLHTVLEDLDSRARPGIPTMRSILADRGPDYRPPDSGLEARFQELLRRDGQREMVRQIDVGGQEWLGRMDFIDRDCHLVVQIDSETYHAALIDRRADQGQTEKLRAAGFTVLRYTDFDVWHRPAPMIAHIRRARRRSA